MRIKSRRKEGVPIQLDHIYTGDCLEVLKTLPDESVHCCITSPPYYALRDYGVDGQIGREATPKEYISRLTEVFTEVRRVLRSDGTLWLNISDTYAGKGNQGGYVDAKNPKGRNGQAVALNYKVEGCKPKDMIGIPWMLAFSLRDSGWYLRNDIIWMKENPMPESVKDRCARCYEHILENREYTGCLVNFKTTTQSYKCSKIIYNDEDKQAIFENHHEPIIDTQTWERVQELRKQRKRPNRYDEVGLFSGILFCADCGSVMYQQRYQTDKRKQDCYICGNYKKRTHDCTAHFIRTDLLTAGVLSNLRKVTSYAAKHEARFMKLLIEQNEDGGKRRNAAKKKELEAAEKRIAELSAIFKRLYEDSVTGRISDERFTELSADYEAEQRELKERAAAIQAELSKAQEATVNAEKFMNVVRRHTSFEELTPTLLREFVEKIVVHECSYDENKTRRQDIEIYYSFVGKVDLPE